MTLVLLPLAAVGITTSPARVAAVTVATTAAWPLFGLPAGWVVDRVDRRRLLIAVNLGRAAVLALVAVVAGAGELTLSVLCAAALALGIGETLADTALTSLVPMVTPAANRGRANARLETTINLLNQFVGPPLAGLLVSVGVAFASGLASSVYAMSLMGLLLMSRRSFRAPAGLEASGGWRREITAGINCLWQDQLLRRLTLLTAAMNVVWAAWAAVFVVYAVSPGPLGLAPGHYGVLLTAMAVGGVAAAPLVEPLTRALGVRPLMLLDLIGTALLVVPAAAGWNVLAVSAGLVLASAGSTVWRVIAATIRHNLVDESLMGRAYSATRLISWGVLPLSAAAACALASATSLRTVFVACSGLAALLLVSFGLLTRGSRFDDAYGRTPRRVPPADPVADVAGAPLER